MKKTILNLALMLIAVCAFAQAPDWQWATHAGGSGSDRCNGIVIDDNCNSYVTGRFEGTATFGEYSLTSSEVSDIFVAKMDVNGNWLWATQACGNNYNEGNAIAIDDNSNSYVTGYFFGTATFGSYSLTSSGHSDIFVAKMDVNGNWLWAVQAGGSAYDYSAAIAIDDNGNSYVTGCFSETATFGSYSLTSNSSVNIFVAKMDANGNWLWATEASGEEYEWGFGITIDDDGNSYVTGCFEGTATFGEYSLTSSGWYDIFVAKLDANGSWLWAVQAGGSAFDQSIAIAIDDNSNNYVTGFFSSTATFGSYSLTSSGSHDIFVAKMNANGNWLWATEAGGEEDDWGYGIAIDDNGNSYVTGSFRETATFGAHTLSSSEGDDIYVAKIDATGNWQWATEAGGEEDDWGDGIAIDDNGNSYVTGSFSDTAIFGAYTLSSSGYYNDIYVAKLGNDTSVENEIIPTKIDLSNYPNPFNPTTTITFSILEESEVDLSIYNIKGQKIKSLLSDQIEAGEHSIVWNGKDASGKKVGSGVYLYELNVKGKTEAVKKCLLLK